MSEPEPDNAPLVLRLFGPMEVQVEGQPLPRLATRKRLWLLALLALRQGRDVDRLWLAGTLWPDSTEPQAFASLRQSLTEIRRALGPQAHRLCSTVRSVRLDLTEAFCDVLAFDDAVRDETRLHEALPFYRGPLLEGCTEEWVWAERETREQAYLKALQTLAGQARGRGDPGEAARLLRRAVTAAPLEESTQRALMEALAAQGDPAAATQVYRDLRSLLHRELNTAPATETTALFQRLREPPSPRASPRPPSPDPAGSLPQPRTAFIGREREVAQIKALLGRGALDERDPHRPRPRLVTLTGTGGLGKTRLAIRTATEIRTDFPEGVWFVDLSALADPALVPEVTASTLGVREVPGRPILETLTDHLKEKRLLLVVDNCEHLAEACARLADTLLARCRWLCLLATSRQALGIPGEVAWRVPSLSLPPETEGSLAKGAVGPVEALLDYASVRLFTERVLDHEPRFGLNAENAPCVTQICRCLDGIPLALELAAARAKVLSVPQIAERLRDRFRLLTGGSRTAPTRQQTLRAALDWSYELLSEPERLLLRRLSVFAGGFTLEAVEQVTGDRGEGTGERGEGTGERGEGTGAEQRRQGDKETRRQGAGGVEENGPSPLTPHPSPLNALLPQTEVLDLLEQLVDKSLVLADTQGPEARYRLLETIRQYGWERLEEEGQRGALRERHRDYFLALAEEAEPHLMGGEQAVWLERLEAEHDNLRAALECCRVEGNGAERGLQSAGVLWRFWQVRGHLREGRGWLEEALQRNRDAPAKWRAYTLNKAGLLAWNQGDLLPARSFHEESLILYRQLGNKTGIAGCLNNLGLVLLELGEYAAARSLFEESLALKRELGEEHGVASTLLNLGNVSFYEGRNVSAHAFYEESLVLARKSCQKWGIGLILNNLAEIVLLQKDHASARALLEESLAIRRELGDRQGIAQSLNGLGNIACDQGNHAAAYLLYAESLQMRQKLDDRRGISDALCNFAYLAAVCGQPERAVRLFGTVESIHEATGAHKWPHQQEREGHTVATLRAALGTEGFAAMWAEGRAMTMQQAIAYALENEECDSK